MWCDMDSDCNCQNLYLHSLETPASALTPTVVVAATTAAAITTTATTLVHVVGRGAVVTAILLVPSGPTTISLLAIVAKVLVAPAPTTVTTAPVTAAATATLVASPTSPLVVIPRIGIIPSTLVTTAIATCKCKYNLKLVTEINASIKIRETSNYTYHHYPSCHFCHLDLVFLLLFVQRHP